MIAAASYMLRRSQIDGDDDAPLLSVRDLSIEFDLRGKTSRPVEGVSFDLFKRETLGIIGESGSGKSITAHAILQICNERARVSRGSIMFGSIDLLTAAPHQMQEIRGKRISMIFQNPVTALDPITPTGYQIEKILRHHLKLSSRQARERAIEMLAEVKIPRPKHCAKSYPFELSGGTCQRVMIALALACSPEILIADEPTTSLDVTIQIAIMNALHELTEKNGMSTILISHDLNLAAAYCDRIVVMHAGHVVELAPTAELFANPLHPYTRALLAATPGPRSLLNNLHAIPGSLPDPTTAEPEFCRFRQRCNLRDPECDQAPLPYVRATPSHWVACWRYEHGTS